MKLVSKQIDKDGTGKICLVPQEGEDMWNIYNVICVGDIVQASTLRKVQMTNSMSATGGNSFRVRTTLTVKVEAVDFDTQVSVLRLKGRNMCENEYVKIGAYHTLDIELNRQLTIEKVEWDSVALDVIDSSCDVLKTADLAAIVMHQGLAHVCLITRNMTLVRARIEKHVPKKRKGHPESHEQGLIKFFKKVMDGMLRHFDFQIVKCVLIASPGFLKEQFLEYVMQEATKADNKAVLDNKSKFIQAHSSSGFKTALKDVLTDESVMSKVGDTKAYAEIKALEEFYATMKVCEERTYYGFKHVSKANDAQAIETLLISDSLFRSNDVNTRKQYVNLVDSAKESGAQVRIFSSLHISGEQLNNMTGVAAILRFPMPEIEAESDAEPDSDDDSDTVGDGHGGDDRGGDIHGGDDCDDVDDEFRI